MDRNELEAEVLDMLEDICDDEAVREERDIDLFAAGLLDSSPLSKCSSRSRSASVWTSRPPRSSARK